MTTQISGDTGVSRNALPFFIGVVVHFPAAVAPAGFIEADGSLKSRATYAALWSFAQASGNLAASDGVWVAGQFSPGDGSTTFRVPDLRAEFLRGWDHGKGVDAGRAIGTAQAEAAKLGGVVLLGGSLHRNNWSYGTGSTDDGSMTNGTATSRADGAETRPRNIALMPCIFVGV